MTTSTWLVVLSTLILLVAKAQTSGVLRDHKRPNAYAPRPYPTSSFSCRGRPPGYYADMSLNCEVYHLCNRHGGGMAFECPRGTAFQQRTMVCDHSHSVQCEKSDQFYHINLRIGQRNLKLIDDPVVFMKVVVKDDNKALKTVTRAPKQLPRFQVVVRDSIVLKRNKEKTERPSKNVPKGLQGQGKGQVSFGLNGFFVNQGHYSTNFGNRGARKFKPSVQIHKEVKKRQRKKMTKNKRPAKANPVFPNFPALQQTLPEQFIQPPTREAPVAQFSKKFRTQPLNSLRLPPKAKVVGVVKPLRPLALSNRHKSPSVLTLNEFLQQVPRSKSVKTVAVPVKSSHAKVIEHLAHSKAKQPLQGHEHQFFQELDLIIANRSSRRIKPLDDMELPVKPRGAGPSTRFSLTSEGQAPPPALQGVLTPPKLEFGFVPITSSTPRTTLTPTTTPTTTFAVSEVTTEGAFFFTTTESPAKEALDDVNDLGPGLAEDQLSKKKKKPAIDSSLFDTRNLFYIPADNKPLVKLKPKKKKKTRFRPFFSP